MRELPLTTATRMGSGSVGAPGSSGSPSARRPDATTSRRLPSRTPRPGTRSSGRRADHSGAELYEKGGDVVEFTIVDQKDSRPGPHDVPRSRARRAARPLSIGRIGRTL